MTSTKYAALFLVTAPLTNLAYADVQNMPELLIGLLGDDAIRLTPQESADTRGESMKKKEIEYGHCGLQRCTKTFVDDKHLYTVFADGSVYFVKH